VAYLALNWISFKDCFRLCKRWWHVTFHIYALLMLLSTFTPNSFIVLWTFNFEENNKNPLSTVKVRSPFF
jgi:hypothetical protein